MIQVFNFEIYASAARTATPTAVTLTAEMLKNARAIDFILESTEVTATPDVVVTIDGQDNESSAWYNLLTSASIATVSTNILRVGISLTNVANLVANCYIPDVVRFVATHGDADSITYSVGAKIYK